MSVMWSLEKRQQYIFGIKIYRKYTIFLDTEHLKANMTVTLL
jgi:hypothetical protein